MTLINVPSFAPINQKGIGFRTQKENNFVEIFFCKRSKIIEGGRVSESHLCTKDSILERLLFLFLFFKCL